MSDTLLHATWSLRNVDDVEQLCRGVLRRCANGSVRLSPADRDEALGFLLGEAHIQDLKWIAKGYDRRAGYLFRPWLFQQLSSRLIDHWRSWRGRSGEKVVFDERLLQREQRFDDWNDQPEPDDDSGERRLVDAAAEVAVDGPEVRTDAYQRFYAEGDREVLRSVGGLGVGTREAAASGHPRAADHQLVEEAA